MHERQVPLRVLRLAKGEHALPSTTSDYSRVALVVSMAAVFASLYLDAAFSRFDLFKDSVMSGGYGKKPQGK